MKKYDFEISKTTTAKKTNQIILIVENSFIFFIKEKETWKKMIETKCYFGKNGFSASRHSGDLTTPIGSYQILYSFGTEENVNTKIEYRKITSNSYFSDDENNLEQYNTWVESKNKIIGEHLIKYPKEYHYALAIGFNINPKVKGKGSSIFLHCKGEKPYTAGCIAIDEKIMIKLLKKINPKCYIIIVPNKDYILRY